MVVILILYNVIFQVSKKMYYHLTFSLFNGKVNVKVAPSPSLLFSAIYVHHELLLYSCK